MSEFRTTATHEGRDVPMPEVDTVACDGYTLRVLRNRYDERTESTISQDNIDFRDRIRADALASAAPSEDAIRVREREAFRQGVIAERAGVAWVNERDRLYPAPRPVYAAPVVLGNGDTFGQTGPDKFTRTLNKGSAFDASAQYWRDCNGFRPADGALVLAVLDGAEATR
jgi:hypothetical protein